MSSFTRWFPEETTRTFGLSAYFEEERDFIEDLNLQWSQRRDSTDDGSGGGHALCRAKCAYPKGGKKEFTELKPNLHDRYFLLISAPVSTARGGILLDDEARRKQFDHIRFEHHGVRQYPDRNPTMMKSCMTYDEMRTAIKSFLTITSSLSSSAVIIFNGHGTEEGNLVFDADKNHKTSVADICEHVMEDMAMRKSSANGQTLPARIELVFLQCYAHVAEPGSIPNDLEVYRFTSPKQKKTHSGTEYDKLNGELIVVASRHYALGKFIKQHNEKLSK